MFTLLGDRYNIHSIFVPTHHNCSHLVDWVVKNIELCKFCFLLLLLWHRICYKRYERHLFHSSRKLYLVFKYILKKLSFRFNCNLLLQQILFTICPATYFTIIFNTVDLKGVRTINQTTRCLSEDQAFCLHHYRLA